MNNLQHIFNCLQTQNSINASLIEDNLDKHDKKFYLNDNPPNLAYADNPHDETSIALSTAFFYCLSYSFDTIDFVEIELMNNDFFSHKIKIENHSHLIIEPWEDIQEKIVEGKHNYLYHSISFRPTKPTIDTQALLQETPFNKFKKNSIALTEQDIMLYFKEPFKTHLLSISQNACLNEHFMARLSQINPDKKNNFLIKFNQDNFNVMMEQYFSKEAKFLSVLKQHNNYLIDYSDELKKQANQNQSKIKSCKQLM